MLALALLGLTMLQATGPDSLSLAEALAFARQHRGTVAATQALLAEARAGFRQAGAVPNPTGVYNYTESPPKQTVILQQPLDWLFGRGPRRGVARAQVARAVADSAQSSVQLTAEVRRAFYRVLAAELSHGIAEEQLKLADSLQRLAAVRLSRGDIAESEYDRLRLEATVARQALTVVEAGEAGARLLLARDLGWPDHAAIPPLAGSLGDDLDEVPSAAALLEELPLVRGALADSAAAAAQLRAARAAQVPLPSVEVGAQWNDPSARGQTLLLAGVSIPLPLFDWGGAGVAAADARLRRAQASALEARLEARQRIADAEVQLRASQSRAVVARDSLLPGAQRVRTRAARAYALGETGVLPLLEAFRAERDIVLGAVADLVAYQEALADWRALEGRAE